MYAAGTGFSEATFYKWKAKYGSLEVSEVSVSQMLPLTSSAARVSRWRRRSAITVSALSSAAAWLSWAWIAFSMWLTSRTLVDGT